MNPTINTTAPPLSASKQALLKQRLRGAIKSTAKHQPIAPRSQPGPAPLSFTQQQLWFIDQLEPGSSAYILCTALQMQGRLHVPALEQGLNAIISRHEILRTVFPASDGNPVQVVLPARPAPLYLTDISSRPAEERAAEAQRLIAEEACRSFNLAQGPLVRFRLVRLSEQEHILVLAMHHIISDGWSMALFYRELELLYQAHLTQAPAPLPTLPIQYADFAVWQEQQFQDGAVGRRNGPPLTPTLSPSDGERESHLDYWKEKLAGAPEKLALPLDFSSPAQSRSQGDQVSLQLSPALQEQLLHFCQARQTTPFLAMLAALDIVFYHWTTQSDLVLGTVVSGRTRRETESLLGCFMNFLPLRVKVKKEETGAALLEQIKGVFLEASSHQECPFQKIVEAVNPARKLNQNPLYNAAFLVQNWPRSRWQNPTLQARELPVKAQAPLLDLRWVAEEADGKWRLTCEYDAALFAAETAQHLLESFRLVLEKLLAHPEAAIDQFQIAPGLKAQAERVRAQRPQENVCVAATFTAEPLEESLRFWAEELELPLTIQFAPYNQVFQQLLDAGSLLAANTCGVNVLLLRLEDWSRSSSQGNPSPQPSPRPTERGGASDGDPLERNMRDLLEALKSATARTSIPWLICLCPSSEHATRNTQHAILSQIKSIPGIHLLTAEELFAYYPVTEYADAQADQIGHVPYTPLFYAALGTMIIRKFHALKRPPRKVIALDCDNTLWTGVCGEDGPQGIALEGPRLALQQFLRRQYEAGLLLCLCSKNNEEDVWAVFKQRLEMPLRREHLAAWRLNWRSKSENLRSLAAELRLGLDSFIFIDDNPIECAEVESACPEVLTVQLPETQEDIPQFLQHLWVLDVVKLTAEDRNRNLLYQQNRAREQLQAQSLSFADFLASLNLNILIEEAGAGQLPRIAQLTQRTNQFNCSTRRCSETELRQVAEGKQKQVLAVSVKDRFGDYGLVGALICETTAEALVAESFLLSCRALGKGVEHQMLAHLGQMAQARGLARVDVPFRPSPKNQPALRFLESVGAAFRQSSHEISTYRFSTDFAANIVFQPQEGQRDVPAAPPPKSTPSGFALPARFPRGQWIARQAQTAEAILMAIESKLRSQACSSRPYAPPRTVTEEQLCRIWAELLRVSRVGIKDDFFELGGTSLLAVRFFAHLQKTFAKTLPLVTLFKAPTIEQLAPLLEQKKTKLVNSSIVAIQPKGTRPPLILVHGAGGGLLWGYANLAANLGPGQPVYAIEPRQRLAASAFATVEEMARRYVQELCEFQPRGPYYLGGYCFGGYIAYEMACQLSAQGKSVALLALIDAPAPNGSYARIPWWRPGFAYAFLRNCYYWYENFRKWESQEQRRFLKRKTTVAVKRILRKVGLNSSDPDFLEVEDFIDPSNFPEDELALWQKHLHAGGKYIPQKYPGKVTLLRTKVQPIFCSLDPLYGWGELAQAGVNLKLITGSHENIFLNPDLQSLAAALKDCLAQTLPANSSQP